MSEQQNTDRELWRKREGDYYADSIHVTEGGGIGMNVGGFVVVMPIREWHALAAARSLPPEPSDEQLLAAFVAGCNRENELSDAELSPENIRAGIAAAMRAALRAAYAAERLGSPEGGKEP